MTYSFEQTEKELKELSKMLDRFHELNTSKEIEKDENLQAFAKGLRKSCVALGYIRYKICRDSSGSRAMD